MADGLKAVGLPNRGVIKVSGNDARAFLDTLVTTSMQHVAPGRAIHTALLTPQGKIIADFFVTEGQADDGGGFYCDAPLMTTAELAKRLTFYRLRAKVEISDLSDDLGVMAVWGGTVDLQGLSAFADPRLPELGYRVIAHRSQFAAVAADLEAEMVPLEAYHARRARLGIGEVAFDFVQGAAFPHEINMDQLHGIDFRKGCYVGQEVVSRMEHRANARTRLVQLHYLDGFVASEGSDVIAGERHIGQTGTAANGIGLAMLRLDRAADALLAGTPITAGGLAVSIIRPTWWTADWPISAEQTA